MKTRRPPTISLRDAYRWVLAAHETFDGAPPDQRLGHQPGELARIKDPEFRAMGTRFSFHPLPQHRRGRPDGDGMVPLRPVLVPPVPTSEQLETLLLDFGEFGETQTPWERRLCLAHTFLADALLNCGLQAWADRRLVPDNLTRPPRMGVNLLPSPRSLALALPRSQSVSSTIPGANANVVPGEDGAIPLGNAIVRLEWLKDCAFGYADSRVNPKGNEWEECPDDINRYRGRIELHDVRVDRSELAKLLTRIGERHIEASIGLKFTSDSGETWVITWGREEIEITKPLREVEFRRGMRAIALLLRHHGKPISILLLESLIRGGRHGPRAAWKDEDKDDVAFRDALWHGTDAIATKLYDATIDVHGAHLELVDFLHGLLNDHQQRKDEFRIALSVAPLGTTKPIGRQERSLECTKVANVVTKSIMAARDAIRDFGECGRVVNGHFERIRMQDPYFWQFRRNLEGVSWLVGTDEGHLTSSQGSPKPGSARSGKQR